MVRFRWRYGPDPQKAEIITPAISTLKVWNDSVSDPTEVRYCFRNYVQGELCINAGLGFFLSGSSSKKKPACIVDSRRSNSELVSHKDSIDYI
ncbi:hypothetical protein NXW37_29570 [Bacteroides thetaiotaomicron]|nr:hypothetical protein [Bacteroides thetaiotaomicron]